MEYPPGAIPTFLAPLALTGLAHYNLAFKFTVAFAGLGLILACAVALRLLDAERSRMFATYGLLVAAPAALGAVELNRYDLWPTLLCVLALVALLARRPRLGLRSACAGLCGEDLPARRPSGRHVARATDHSGGRRSKER